MFSRSLMHNSLEDMLRAQYMVAGMNLCGYDVATLGEKDFLFGEAFLADRLQEAQFAVTSANLYSQSAGQPYVDRFFTTHWGEHQIGVVGVTDEELSTNIEDMSSVNGTTVTVRDVTEEITDTLNEMGSVDLVILLAHMSLTKARKLALGLSGVDIVVASHQVLTPQNPEPLGETLLVNPGYQGKWMGQLDIELSPAGELSKLQWKLTELDDGWPNDPILANLYEDYLERLEKEADNIADNIEQQVPPGGSYVGAQECQSCHTDEYSQWVGTSHASAFGTLVETNHDYSPSCYPCHSTGFGFVGGFLLPDRTPTMGGVQCESCHGAGAEHVATPDDPWPTQPTAVCTGCHNQEHSPNFDLQVYLPLVTHGPTGN